MKGVNHSFTVGLYGFRDGEWNGINGFICKIHGGGLWIILGGDIFVGYYESKFVE
jgi:hypothetical protein